MKTQLILFALAMLVLLYANPSTGFSYALIGVPEGLKPAKALGELFTKANKLFFEGLDQVKSAIKESSDGISAEFTKTKEALLERIKTAEEQVKNSDKVNAETKSEVAKLVEKHQEFVKLIDDQLANMKTLSSAKKPGIVSLDQYLKDLFSQKGQKQSTIAEQIRANKSIKQPIEIELKAVGDLSSSNLTGAYFNGYDLRPGFIVAANDAHLRPLFPQLTTEKDTIRYGRQTTKEGAFGMVAPGATKPQIDYDFELFDAPVRKIAGYFRLPEEMIDDIPYLLGTLTTLGLEDLKNTEDDQFLNGDGQGQNLTGIITSATAFAAGGLANRIATANEYDVLVAAKKQLRLLNLLPTAVLVSPEDYASMRLAKNANGSYIFPVQPGTEVITVDGTPIIQNNRIAVDSFIVMDARYAQVVDRTQTQVRLYDQDRDNAIKNMITCVIEERLAFPILRPQAFVKGTFTDAKAAIGV